MNRLTIQAGSTETTVLTWGDASKPTLLCLHGLGGTPLSFNELIAPLVKHFYIFAPYIPGSGATEDFSEPAGYEMPNLVSWLESTIKQLSTDPIFMLSHSWGAHIGLQLQNAVPSLIKNHLMLDGGYYLRKPPTDTVMALEQEIKEQIQSDNEYCFTDLNDYLKAEEGDVNHWNDLLVDAAKDRMILKDGKLRWHLSNDLTDRAFRGIFNASPDNIYESVKSNQLSKNTKLLRATEPASRTDRHEFADIFSAETGIEVEAIPNAGHSIHLDRPAAVIEQALKLFT